MDFEHRPAVADGIDPSQPPLGRTVSPQKPYPLDPESSPTPAQTKLASLRQLLHQMGSVLVCYSGGIDSALVLAVAHEQLGPQALGITAVSPSLAPREREEAVRFAQSIGARHQLIETNEINRPSYVANGPDRCFHCKSELYEVAEKQRLRHDLRYLLNGTNQDDFGDYRPGLDAAKRADVRSPLAELKFTKDDVRQVAQTLGLHIWDKPASACLSSRIPYGTSVTRERLQQIAGFESDLADLGFRQVRVRWHGKVARIELAESEFPRAFDPTIRPALLAAGKEHGFPYVTLDLAGYRVGSHNEVLNGVGSLRVLS